MDGQVGEEDSYSDDDLDALPNNAFQSLEQDAFVNTQRAVPPPRLPVYKSHRPNPAALAGGFGRLSVRPDANTTWQQNGLHGPSSDYGDFDDEMLDGEIFDANEQPSLAAAIQQNLQNCEAPGESTQREIWRQQRYARSEPVVPTRAQERSRAFESHVPSILPDQRGAVSQTQAVNGHRPIQSSGGGANLQAQVDLVSNPLSCKLTLAHLLEIQTAKDNTYAKFGEIAIVRANASKIEKEYENRAKAMQKDHSDEVTRQRLELEKAKAELQKIATEKDFLENDLAEGTKQVRNLQQAMKNADKSVDVKTTTPKKQRSGLGDGFDDGEIQPLSPSKLALRAKVGTPKAGSKRKRKPPGDSPTKQSLELDRPLGNDSSGDRGPALQKTPSEPTPQAPIRQDQDLTFLQRFLDHHLTGFQERTIETLARYKFPSQPSMALSTLLLDKLSPLHMSPNTTNLPSAIALEVISLLAQCIQEKYHDPIRLLVDQVMFILMIKPFKIAPDLTNSLMSLLQEIADVVIIPRCQKKSPRPDRAQISSTDCLETMRLMATQVSPYREESTRFWRTIRFDFVMMLLSFIHPIHELHLTLRILHTSILANSFAMIIPPGDGKQDATESRVLENLSRLLVEPPRPTQGEPLLTGLELAGLRLSILDLVQEMAANDYAVLAICRHKLLIGRLVRLMNDSLAHAYDYTAAHSLLIALVNQATRLLFYFMQNYTEHFNIAEKLSVIPGGEKKFLIVLTRLAFSEGLFLEEGIEDDVMDIAQRMLEERVSPEEAEGLMGVMSTAPSTRATTTRRASINEVEEGVPEEGGDEENKDKA
ncbi:uncharacterized protein KY384_007437 [Bacidia gigantensis]|uniref:uncharacterized protein n=1 Tax=Bacidia gigantensis TaxID=2732470 RepID=UPI001D03C9A5|nr:uncharacterized protein KY384_007437 [Bacidia gigantensis]KAG8528519.1 hypothetical protein KY384_007437 [Bacidia gigantensis]